MDFIRKYCEANAGTSVPIRYHRWAAISLLCMTMGRRVFVNHGHFQIRPMMYICLVGDPASKKTSAKDKAKEMFLSVHPQFPIGASVISREKIVEMMSKDDGIRTYTDELGALQQFKPLYFFINEFKNFLSVNPAGMIDFLTDIYDTKFFDAATLKHGLQPIINPCINILACDTPNNIIDKLKLSLIGGGFSRRLLFVYETDLPPRVAFPTLSKESLDAWAWCETHLRNLSSICGPVIWTPEARAFHATWYESLKPSTDPVLQGYYDSKDILVQKVAMALCAARSTPDLVFTPDILEASVALLDANEDNLPKLTVAAGRNELAVFYYQLVQSVINAGGLMPEARFHKLAAMNMTESEYLCSKSFLKSTNQIYECTYGGQGSVVMTAAKYAELKEKGQIS